MAKTTALTIVNTVRAIRAEPCCNPGECDYSPERVRKFLATIRKLKGECSPIEAVRSVHFGQRGHGDESRVSDLGSGSRAEAAARVVADLVRAIQAGKRDSVTISQFLCPIATPPPLVDEKRSASVS